ncbi:MAG: hypothetical protein K6F56_10155 [Oscillospiraceae bacterium]|nr:hypothetical protein [Oscillospiraceae bacterium]
MTPRHETASGTINALQLLFFLGGALTLLFWEQAPIPDSLQSGDAPLWVTGLVLCADVLLCMSPLALAVQPLVMCVLGAACCREAHMILQAPGDAGIRLLLLLLLVPLCFLLGGRGIWNGLLLARVIRADPDGLGSSVRLGCVLAIFGLAALCLLGRILRYS